MSGPIAAAAEAGLVALEWPTSDIAPDFLRPEAHAALLTVARREAQRLGLQPSDGGAVVYVVRKGLVDEAVRFVWGDDGSDAMVRTR
jgi:hypothetical protein